MNEDRASRQEAFWDSKYSEDPSFFGSCESDFSHWALPFLQENGTRRILELGSGYGRDSAFLCDRYMSVTSVEISGIANREARNLLAGRKDIKLYKENATRFLSSSADVFFDAVYSNLFLNMHFTMEEHKAIFKEITRVLRPGGLHLFSVRSVSDPWYGRGVRVAADTFDQNPEGTTMVYFSKERLREITPGQLLPLKMEEVEEGQTEFPIHVLYVAQVKARQ